MDEDDKWKRRFYVFMGARLFGLATFIIGLAVAFTDLVRPGGWRTVGAVIVIFGLIDAVVGPYLLRKQWKKEDQAAGQKDR